MDTFYGIKGFLKQLQSISSVSWASDSSSSFPSPFPETSFHNSSFFLAASGLQMLRDNNVVHRDLKPQVILPDAYFQFPTNGLIFHGSRFQE
jgi:serine/threonine protein kinase